MKTGTNYKLTQDRGEQSSIDEVLTSFVGESYTAIDATHKRVLLDTAAPEETKNLITYYQDDSHLGTILQIPKGMHDIPDNMRCSIGTLKDNLIYFMTKEPEARKLKESLMQDYGESYKITIKNHGLTFQLSPLVQELLKEQKISNIFINKGDKNHVDWVGIEAENGVTVYAAFKPGTLSEITSVRDTKEISFYPKDAKDIKSEEYRIDLKLDEPSAQ